jgi:putative SOS response-associated peptidase YedK
MCGRIFIKPGVNTSNLLAGLGLECVELPTLNNVAPTEQIPVIGHNSAGELCVQLMRWWLHPSWSKEPPNQQYATFNARIETVLTSPSFRGAIRHHRGIVPASGFVEWKQEGKVKQPYFIEGQQEPLAVAAVFDIWNHDVLSCAIITQPADNRFSHIHHRMPLALSIEQANAWLDLSIPSPDLIHSLKGSCIDLRIQSVETSVNNARNKNDVQRKEI